MIFVDTSFWVALTIHVDRRHGDARELLAARADVPLATSNHVRGETWTFVRRRFGHRAAVGVIDRLERTPRLRILQVGRDDERDVWEWLRVRAEREYSFVDATSFAVMHHFRIHEAFAFDGDFAAAGFVELRA